MRENRLDKKIREKLSPFTQKPPIDIWEAIEGNLPQKGATESIGESAPQWGKRAIFALSAVAAVVLLFFVINMADTVVPVTTPSMDAQYISKVDNTNQDKIVPKDYIAQDVEQKTDQIADQKTDQKTDQIAEQNEFKSHQKQTESQQVEQQAESQQVEEQAESQQEQKRQESRVVRSHIYEEPVRVSKKRRGASMAFSSQYSPGMNVSSQYKTVMRSATTYMDFSNSVMGIRNVYERTSESQYSAPLSFGIQLNIPLGDRFFAGVGLNYTYLHSKYNVLSNGNRYNIDQSLHYIGFPLSVGYHFVQSGRLSFYAVGGFTLEKGVRANYKESSVTASRTYSESVKGFGKSLNLGVGLEYRLFNKAGIYFDPGVSYYWFGNQPSSIRVDQPLQFRGEIGIRIHL